MAKPILMTEGYWANSQFSVVRYTGRMKWNGVTYIICNKEGKDIFECHGVHHLHQLQNAYYMATGEELEIQP